MSVNNNQYFRVKYFLPLKVFLHWILRAINKIITGTQLQFSLMDTCHLHQLYLVFVPWWHHMDFCTIFILLLPLKNLPWIPNIYAYIKFSIDHKKLKSSIMRKPWNLLIPIKCFQWKLYIAQILGYVLQAEFSFTAMLSVPVFHEYISKAMLCVFCYKWEMPVKFVKFGKGAGIKLSSECVSLGEMHHGNQKREGTIRGPELREQYENNRRGLTSYQM